MYALEHIEQSVKIRVPDICTQVCTTGEHTSRNAPHNACTSRAHSARSGPTAQCAFPGHSMLFGAFHALCSVYGICYNNPKDLLQPSTVQFSITERYREIFTFLESIKKSLSRDRKNKERKKIQRQGE